MKKKQELEWKVSNRDYGEVDKQSGGEVNKVKICWTCGSTLSFSAFDQRCTPCQDLVQKGIKTDWQFKEDSTDKLTWVSKDNQGFIDNEIISGNYTEELCQCCEEVGECDCGFCEHCDGCHEHDCCDCEYCTHCGENVSACECNCWYCENCDERNLEDDIKCFNGCIECDDCGKIKNKNKDLNVCKCIECPYCKEMIEEHQDECESCPTVIRA